QWPALHNADAASIWMREILLQEASSMDYMDAIEPFRSAECSRTRKRGGDVR
ncbi:NodD protein NodD2, partial CDS, partial [Neorhizobium galegae bv. officinalis]